MGGLLGWLAGCGMLMLIGILLLLFLRDIHVLPGALAKAIAVTGLQALAVGMLYLFACMLLRQAMYQDVESAEDFARFIPGGYWQEMAGLLKSPAWRRPLTSLFAYSGHFLGNILFGQYLSAGWALAFLLTILSAVLVFIRLRACIGGEGAAQCVFLLLCLPSSVFCFLPGWPPMAALLIACLFFFLGRLIPRRAVVLPRPVYIAALAASGVLSAFSVAALTLGRIG